MTAFPPRQSLLDSFLTEIVTSLRSKNGVRISELIQLDFEGLSTERQQPYADLNGELNSNYARGNDAELVQQCKRAIAQHEFGSFATAFSESILLYFRYLRDFTTADNQAKASEIRQLTSQCITALGDSKYGVVMIPIVLSFSRTLAAVATNLDRNPSLLRQAHLPAIPSADEAPGKVTFVEDAANVLRDAFIKCLAGSPGVQRTSRPSPDDKRIGIYLTANSCLKLLFQCRKLRNAQQMFISIDTQSPPLSFYPAAQRVTYLYYLGRYHFANNHFYRAQIVLQAAYDQCHRDALKHRKLILIYLIAANICLGRFPSSKLLMRREATDIAQRFRPLCRIIQTGDLGRFHRFLELKSENTQWYLQKRILLQLRNRCDIMVWRSLIRQTFLCSGFKGEEKKIPFLRLSYVQHAARWATLPQPDQSSTENASSFGHPPAASFTVSGGPRASNGIHRMKPDDHDDHDDSSNYYSSSFYIDPDFAEIDEAINETGFDVETGTYIEENMGQHVPYGDDGDEASPTMYEVESIFMSLIQQGLLKGFLLHAGPRFAIPGSQKAGGPMQAGFPSIWSVIDSRHQDDTVVPGWVREENLNVGPGVNARAGASMAGRVVRLSGARAVGVGS